MGILIRNLWIEPEQLGFFELNDQLISFLSFFFFQSFSLGDHRTTILKVVL
jgi:hypothetical protein